MGVERTGHFPSRGSIGDVSRKKKFFRGKCSTLSAVMVILGFTPPLEAFSPGPDAGKSAGAAGRKVNPRSGCFKKSMCRGTDGSEWSSAACGKEIGEKYVGRKA